MKKSLLIFLILTATNCSFAQVTSNCIIPQVLKDSYFRDVRQLAVERMFQIQSSDTSLVKIPQEYIDSIFSGLASIYNAHNIPERDSVFDLYCVHNLNPFSGYGDYDGILVKVDTSFAWTSSWQNLNTLTGDPLMDTILNRYDLTVTNFYNWVIGNYAVISSDSSWNNYALIDSLEMVNGVLLAEQNTFVGVAGKISFAVNGNARYYNFDFEFQDCSDGCDAYRRWMFKVNSDCSVEYLGYSDYCFWGVGQCPFPSPLNCNSVSAIYENIFSEEDIVISPNPLNGKFQMEIKGNLQNATVEIYDQRGVLIFEQGVFERVTSIDLTNQKNGVYFLNYFDQGSVIVKKLIKY